MPNIYMLNLVFNNTDSDSINDARFMEFDQSQPLLLRSKVWLLAATSNPGQDDPNAWTQPEQDTVALSIQPQDQIWVRVAGWQTNSTWTARVTTVVARATSRAIKNPSGHHYQLQASPFQGSLSSGQSCVIFDSGFNAMPQGGVSWLQQLGAAVITTPGQKPQNYYDAYSVVVAITCLPAPGQQTQVYSHDPDMNVDC